MLAHCSNFSDSHHMVLIKQLLTWQVWDSLGRQLYQSAPLLSVVTAVAWSPTSEVFTVGAYNSLLLCHASGWLCSKVGTAFTGRHCSLVHHCCMLKCSASAVQHLYNNDIPADHLKVLSMPSAACAMLSVNTQNICLCTIAMSCLAACRLDTVN